jgi:hypothetical protein
MSNVKERNLQRMAEHMSHVDELALVVLKGHLLLDEHLEGIIKGFVFHPSYLEDANLRFGQKVAVARSMSLDEYTNRVWDLILAINGLRNELSHSLTSARRQQRFERVKTLYLEINTETTAEDRAAPDYQVASYAVALALGFLGSFEEEVVRFRDWVGTLDRVVNPHRHKASGS